MPRHVRNWWLEGTIDGRDTDLSGGPIAKDGGFQLTIRQRDRGTVTTPLTIEGYVDTDTGALTLNVFGPDGRIYQHVTTR